MITTLCVMILVASYNQFSNTLFLEYEERLETDINYVETQIDADDLRECLKTGKASETYEREQAFLNDFIDPMKLDYLYIVIPKETYMLNVISATSDAERAAGAVDMGLREISDAYTPQQLQKYADCWNLGETSFFEEASEWGDYYTGCKPLRDSNGETVALICADVSIKSLHTTIHVFLLINALLILFVGIVAGVILMYWLHSNVVTPITSLEKSARDFAENSHLMTDPQQMVRFSPPGIRANNEVRSLSEAITKMSDDIQDYVQSILAAEASARSEREKAENMTLIAYQDSLTHVRSKAAYDHTLRELTKEMEEGDVAFAIMVIDLNELKRINDNYGHENGDSYIIGSCGLICQVFDHSPVFRIGGDEFVVLLRGGDYDERSRLMGKLSGLFAEAASDEGRQPWERYSAAIGLAEYRGGSGETVEQVFRIADERMYRDKTRWKEERNHENTEYRKELSK